MHNDDIRDDELDVPGPFSPDTIERLRQLWEQHALSPWAARIFRLNPSLRSIVIHVSQYYNDGVEDEMHEQFLAYTTDDPPLDWISSYAIAHPQWHKDDISAWEARGLPMPISHRGIVMPGRQSEWDDDGLEWTGSSAAVLLFAPFANEEGNQESTDGRGWSALYKIRYNRDMVGQEPVFAPVVERVGTKHRPWLDGHLPSWCSHTTRVPEEIGFVEEMLPFVVDRQTAARVRQLDIPVEELQTRQLPSGNATPGNATLTIYCVPPWVTRCQPYFDWDAIGAAAKDPWLLRSMLDQIEGWERLGARERNR